MSRLVIDPVTRVGGHLRVEAALDANNVADAWVSGTMFRGMEAVLRGRDPRDAWLLGQRICGACTGVHALASVRAVEEALGVRVPRNALLVRSLIGGTKFVQDGVLHFYTRTLPDWADPTAALAADPQATSTLARSMSDWPSSAAEYFATAQARLRTLVESGPLAAGYAGHPAYRVPPELSLVLYTHYLEALDWQRRLVRARTILAGKSPHPQTYLVGGVAVAAEWGGPTRPGQGEHPWRAARHSPAPLSEDGLNEVTRLVHDSAAFVTGALMPDVFAIASLYPDWEQVGRGYGHFMSYGEFPLEDSESGSSLMMSGRVMDGDLSALARVEQEAVAETVRHAWYTSTAPGDPLLHPAVGETNPSYSGPRPPYTSFEGFEKYSWLKAPRYAEDPMEVGALARLLVSSAGGAAHARIAVDQLADRLASGSTGLMSTLGRSIAPAIEAQVLVGRLDTWVGQLAGNLRSGDLALVDLSMWEPARWPAEASGFGLAEGPRGSVGHWLTIRDRRIADYQVVDASTWNCSPRDGRDRRGALEQALVGTPLLDPARPLEALRTVHSFGPCPACGVH